MAFSGLPVRQTLSRRSVEGVKIRLYRFYLRHYRLLLLSVVPVFLFTQWDIQRHKILFLDRDYSFDAVIYTYNQSQLSKKKTSSYYIPPQMKTDESGLHRHKKGVHNAAKLLPSFRSNPIIPKSVYTPDSSHPLPVIFLGTYESDLLDALDRSKYVRVTETRLYSYAQRRISVDHWRKHVTTTKTPRLYVVDWASLERDCHVLQHMLANDDETWADNNSTYVAYMDTSHSARTVMCPLPMLRPNHHVRYAKRGIVQDRYWNHTAQWIEYGNLIVPQPPSVASNNNNHVLHFPQTLREEFVQALYKGSEQMSSSAAVVVSKLPDVSRRQHVVHFWRKGSAFPYAFLRRLVSTEIMRLGMSNKSAGMRWSVRIVGDEKAMEYGAVDPSYVDQLLRVKIVVVAQFDEWEDHIRLLESMASGALVMTDVMLAPPLGLENMTNVVVYDSAQSLENLILYFLDEKNKKERVQIARMGMEFALGQNRGFHRVEETLFGSSLTRAREPWAEAPVRRNVHFPDNKIATKRTTEQDEEDA